jgi:hypothetical protein
MGTTRMLLTALIGIILWSPVHAQKKLTAAEAKEHFGDNATVCGEVVTTRYAASSKGEPTFLNLDKPYPNQIFTGRDLGQQSTQVQNSRRRLQRQEDLRHRKDHRV